MSGPMTWITTRAGIQDMATARISKAVAAYFINLILRMTDISPNAHIHSVESIIQEVAGGMHWDIDVSVRGRRNGSWFAELMGVDAFPPQERFDFLCPPTVQYCQLNRCNQA